MCGNSKESIPATAVGPPQIPLLLLPAGILPLNFFLYKQGGLGSVDRDREPLQLSVSEESVMLPVGLWVLYCGQDIST